MQTLEPAQQEQLVAFAQRTGRKWKDVLMYEYWMRGIPLLYGLRNTHGPSWLSNYTLPKEPTP